MSCSSQGTGSVSCWPLLRGAMPGFNGTAESHSEKNSSGVMRGTTMNSWTRSSNWRPENQTAATGSRGREAVRLIDPIVVPREDRSCPATAPFAGQNSAAKKNKSNVARWPSGSTLVSTRKPVTCFSVRITVRAVTGPYAPRPRAPCVTSGHPARPAAAAKKNKSWGRTWASR